MTIAWARFDLKVTVIKLFLANFFLYGTRLHRERYDGDLPQGMAVSALKFFPDLAKNSFYKPWFIKEKY